MTLARLAGFAAWLLAASGLGGLAWSALAPLGSARPLGRTPAAPAPRAAVPPEPAESVAAAAVAHDLFRADRRAAAVAYSPTAPARPATAAAGPVRPALSLTGLVWGAVPEAVVAGVPGTDGPRVLRVGDAVGGLRLVRLTPHTAVIVGPDTLWTLTVRNPWP